MRHDYHHGLSPSWPRYFGGTTAHDPHTDPGAWARLGLRARDVPWRMGAFATCGHAESPQCCWARSICVWFSSRHGRGRRRRTGHSQGARANCRLGRFAVDHGNVANVFPLHVHPEPGIRASVRGGVIRCDRRLVCGSLAKPDATPWTCNLWVHPGACHGGGSVFRSSSAGCSPVRGGDAGTVHLVRDRRGGAVERSRAQGGRRRVTHRFDRAVVASGISHFVVK